MTIVIIALLVLVPVALLILKMVSKVMSQLDDLNAAIATVAADLDVIANDIKEVLAALATAQSTNPTTDLSGPITALKNLDVKMNSLNTSVDQVLNPPTPPTV